MKTRKELIERLRHDSNGVPLEDIEENLLQFVAELQTLQLAHIQDEVVLKPNPTFFLSPGQLNGTISRFPLDIFEACGHAQAANTMVNAGKARLIDNAIVGMMVVVT